MTPKWIKDETLCWGWLQEIRSRVELDQDLFYRVPRDRDLGQAVAVVQHYFARLGTMGIDITQTEAGHGTGHVARDYVNTLRLLYGNVAFSPREVFIGAIAGVCHDIGCAVVDRYGDSTRAVEHGAVGALLLGEACAHLLTPPELWLIQYAIAAHTHRLQPREVKCADGLVRRVEPYRDTDAQGKPLMWCWLPRWIDRLDCSGPAFVGRHWLTLGHPHDDTDADGFYHVDLVPHLQPTLRSADEIKAAGGKRTMREHLAMFADSQTNESPYGKHDAGRMIPLRDDHRARLLRIVRAIEPTGFADGEMERALDAWTAFLIHNVEPNPPGRAAAELMRERFLSELDAPTRSAWCSGFLAIMREYRDWAPDVLAFLDRVTPDYRTLLPIAQDLHEVIRPHEEWTYVI